MRLEHQCAQVRRGAEPDDFVDPKTLGPLTRQGVKEAFRAIDRVQRSLVVEYGLHGR
jgi:CBS domain-containing protein